MLTAAELKRRGITRYDAEIIIEQGLCLPDPKDQTENETPCINKESRMIQNPKSGLKNVKDDIRNAVCRGGSIGTTCAQNVHSDFCISNSLTLSKSPLSYMNSGKIKTECNQSSPYAERRHKTRGRLSIKRQRLLTKPLTCALEENLDQNILLPEVEANFEALRENKTGSPRLDSSLPTLAKENSTASLTIRTFSPTDQSYSHVSSTCNSSDFLTDEKSSHLMVHKNFKNCHPNLPLRQSPRLQNLRSDFGATLSKEENTCNSTVNLLEDFNRVSFEDNKIEDKQEESDGLCDKSLDSNHNFHDPPVLEPEVPFPASESCDTLPCANGVHCKVEHDDISLLALNDVPKLSFCGPLSSLNKSHSLPSLHCRSPDSVMQENGKKRKCVSETCSPEPSVLPPRKYPRVVFHMARDPVLEKKLMQCQSSSITIKWKQPKKLKLRFDGNSVERYLPHDTNYPS